MPRASKYVLEIFIGDNRFKEGDKIDFFKILDSKNRAHDVALYYLSLLLDSPEMFPVILDYMVRTETKKLPEKYWFIKTDEDKKYFKIRINKYNGRHESKTLFNIELEIDGFNTLESIKETNDNTIKILDSKCDSIIIPRRMSQDNIRMCNLLLNYKSEYDGKYKWYKDSNNEYWLELFKIDDRKSVYLKQDSNNNYHFRYIAASHVDIVESDLEFARGNIKADHVYEQFMRGRIDLFKFYVKNKKRKVFIADNVTINNQRHVVLGFNYDIVSNNVNIKYVKKLEDKPSIEFSMKNISFFKNSIIPHDDRLTFNSIINEIGNNLMGLCKISSVDGLNKAREKYDNTIMELIEKANKLNTTMDNGIEIDAYRLLTFKTNI